MYKPRQINGAVLVQNEDEYEALLESRPGEIPVGVVDPFTANNPYEPKGVSGDLITDQTILVQAISGGYGGPIGGYAVTPRDTFIPGAN